ncbi:hypothetical protein ACHAPI_007684 [Fusarium lateritium]
MILSHFFWKIGKFSQNTIKGLLCSLVHQLLVGDDEMMDFVLDHDVMGSHMDFNDWSVTALTKVFGRVAEAKMDRLCIFIDGLDEGCNEDGMDNRGTVEKSQGVFLWLYLVLRNLKAGIRNGDSEKMLLERLRELPSELEHLYADMWQRLNENHSVP